MLSSEFPLLVLKSFLSFHSQKSIIFSPEKRNSRKNVNCEWLFVYVNMVNTDCSEKKDLAAYPMFNQKMWSVAVKQYENEYFFYIHNNKNHLRTHHYLTCYQLFFFHVFLLLLLSYVFILLTFQPIYLKHLWEHLVRIYILFELVHFVWIEDNSIKDMILK